MNRNRTNPVFGSKACIRWSNFDMKTDEYSLDLNTRHLINKNIQLPDFFVVRYLNGPHSDAILSNGFNHLNTEPNYVCFQVMLSE